MTRLLQFAIISERQKWTPARTIYSTGATELLIHRALQPAIDVYNKGTRLFPESSRMLIGLGVCSYAVGSSIRRWRVFVAQQT